MNPAADPARAPFPYWENEINEENPSCLGHMSEVRPTPEGGAIDGRRLLTEEERGRMMATIHSMVFWVGVLIPEWELVGDKEVELRDTVFRLTTKDDLSPEDIKRIDDLVAVLTTRERELEKKLAHDPMTVDAAKALLEEIRGLLKAIDDLRSAETDEHASVGRNEVLSRMEDAKRWKEFVERIKPSGRTQF